MRGAWAACAVMVVLAAGMTAGCAGSSAPTAAASPSAGATGGSPCPTPTGTADQPWPAAVPADLPEPPHVRILSRSTRSDGADVIRFWTPQSLREGVLFLVDRLPKAGYTLGRGDSEAREADAPFSRGAVRGQFRLSATQPCRTDWLLVIGRAGSPSGRDQSSSPSAG